MEKNRTKTRKSTAAIEKNIAKFPHLKNVKESIEELKKYVEYLNVRKNLSSVFKETNGSVTQGQYEANEVKILLSETNIKISKANKTISERTEYFDSYYKGLVDVYAEASSQFTELMLSANKLSLDKNWHNYEKLNKELEDAAPYLDKMKNNWELKFRFYLEIKTIINSKPEDKKETQDLKKV